MEFNARFGDPEAQALLPRLTSDFGEVCLACTSGDLGGGSLEWSPRPCVSVVLASGGYPGSYDTGVPIAGLDGAAALDDTFVFHAGTTQRDGEVVTSGGRVLAVSSLGDTFGEARARAYEAAEHIAFEGKHLRTDIALRAEKEEVRPG